MRRFFALIESERVRPSVRVCCFELCCHYCKSGVSLKPFHLVQMSKAAKEFPPGQDLVYVDVGGKVFKMLRQTVKNYPDSLLAKLLRECPNFGKQRKPVYIDRHPAAFEWILEIYRSVCLIEDLLRAQEVF